MGEERAPGSEEMAGGRVELSIILPTYNEEPNIRPLITLLEESVADVVHEILVMDDRSPDGTAAAAREVAGRLPHVHVIEREPPPGLTVSLRDGVERARGRFVVWLDCDLSHPPELMPTLLAPLRSGEADITCASRYAPGGSDDRDSLFERSYSRLINVLAMWMIHRGVRDYTTGYVMGNRGLVRELGLNGDYGEYCIELLGSAALRGANVIEVPYRMVSRTAGESKTAPSLRSFVSRGWKYLATVLRLWRRRLTGQPDSRND